jgi:hypothetical protein
MYDLNDSELPERLFFREDFAFQSSLPFNPRRRASTSSLFFGRHSNHRRVFGDRGLRAVFLQSPRPVESYRNDSWLP